MATPAKVATCLWFDTQGEEAANFYVSLLPGSRIHAISRYTAEPTPSNLPEGHALLVDFELAGTRFQALNGGPMFPQSEAASIVVECDDQAEIDRLWTALTANGGQESQCGWLKDRFGVSWQIVPRALSEMMTHPDHARVARVVAAFMPMAKLDLATIEAAFRGT